MQTPTPSPQNAVLVQGASLDDIRRMIEKAVNERMTAFYENIRQKPPVLVKRKEAAERLGVSLPTLDAYAKAGFLRAQHLGGRVYFDETEVEVYRQKNNK